MVTSVATMSPFSQLWPSGRDQDPIESIGQGLKPHPEGSDCVGKASETAKTPKGAPVPSAPFVYRIGPSHRRYGKETGPPTQRGDTRKTGPSCDRKSLEKREGGLGKTAFSLPMFSPRLALRRLAPAELLRACEAGRRVVWTRNRLFPPSADA